MYDEYDSKSFWQKKLKNINIIIYLGIDININLIT